jgi:hypothetical protein
VCVGAHLNKAAREFNSTASLIPSVIGSPELQTLRGDDRYPCVRMLDRTLFQYSLILVCQNSHATEAILWLAREPLGPYWSGVGVEVWEMPRG